MVLHYYLPTHAFVGYVERSFVFVSTVGLITVIELHFYFVSVFLSTIVMRASK